jgi:hypothetical protein
VLPVVVVKSTPKIESKATINQTVLRPLAVEIKPSNQRAKTRTEYEENQEGNSQRSLGFGTHGAVMPNNLIGRKDFLAIGYYGPNRESLSVPFHGWFV